MNTSFSLESNIWYLCVLSSLFWLQKSSSSSWNESLRRQRWRIIFFPSRRRRGADHDTNTRPKTRQPQDAQDMNTSSLNDPVLVFHSWSLSSFSLINDEVTKKRRTSSLTEVIYVSTFSYQFLKSRKRSKERKREKEGKAKNVVFAFSLD